MTDFQARVGSWLVECFGVELAEDVTQRNHRFLEEALELVQSLGCTACEAHQLVDYVFSRPVGNARQEVGGAIVTLAALCWANGFNLEYDAETELERIKNKIPEIRAKQASKPAHSPLPQKAGR